MRVQQHAIISAGIAAAGYAATRSGVFAAAVFVAGVFVDLDHLIDYWREHPWRFSPAHFFAICENCRLYKVYLWFHSLEFLAALGILAWLVRGDLLFGIFTGLSTHLLFDTVGNPTRPLSYLFIYRYKKGFKMKDVFVVQG